MPIRIKPVTMLEEETGDDFNVDELLFKTARDVGVDTTPYEAPEQEAAPVAPAPPPDPETELDQLAAEMQALPEPMEEPAPAAQPDLRARDTARMFWRGQYAGMDVPGAGALTLVGGRLINKTNYNGARLRLDEARKFREEALKYDNDMDAYDATVAEMTPAQLSAAFRKEFGDYSDYELMQQERQGLVNAGLSKRQMLAKVMRDRDIKDVETFERNVAPTQQEGQERTFGGTVVEMAAQSAPWMAEFAATKAAAANPLTWPLAAGILHTEFQDRLADKIAPKGMAITEDPETGKKTITITQEGADVAKSEVQVAKSMGVEYLSEMSGGMLGKAAGMARRTVAKGLGEATGTAVGRWGWAKSTQAAAGKAVGTIRTQLGRGVGKKLADFTEGAKQVGKAMGFHGIPEEMGEELVAAAAGPLVGAEDVPTVTGDLATDRAIAAHAAVIETLKKTPEMFVAFAIPLGAFGTVHLIKEKTSGPKRPISDLSPQEVQMLKNVAGIRLKLIEEDLDGFKKTLGVPKSLLATEETQWLTENANNVEELFRVFGGYLQLKGLQEQDQLPQGLFEKLSKAGPDQFDEVITAADALATDQGALENMGLTRPDMDWILDAETRGERTRRIAMIQQDLVYDQLLELGYPEQEAKRQAVSIYADGIDQQRLLAAGFDRATVDSLLGMYGQMEALKNAPEGIERDMEISGLRERMGDLLQPTLSQVAANRAAGKYATPGEGPDGKLLLLDHLGQVWRAAKVSPDEVDFWQSSLTDEDLAGFLAGDTASMTPERVEMTLSGRQDRIRRATEPTYEEILAETQADQLATSRPELPKADLTDRLAAYWRAEGASDADVAQFLVSISKRDVDAFLTGTDPDVFRIDRMRELATAKAAERQTKAELKAAEEQRKSDLQRVETSVQAMERRAMGYGGSKIEDAAVVTDDLEALLNEALGESPTSKSAPAAKPATVTPAAPVEAKEHVIPRRATPPVQADRIRTAAGFKAEGDTIGKSYRFGGGVWKAVSVRTRVGEEPETLLERRVEDGVQLRVARTEFLGEAVEPEFDAKELHADAQAMFAEDKKQASVSPKAASRHYKGLLNSYLFFRNPESGETADRMEQFYGRLLALRNEFPALKEQYPDLPLPTSRQESKKPEIDLADINVGEKPPKPPDDDDSGPGNAVVPPVVTPPVVTPPVAEAVPPPPSPPLPPPVVTPPVVRAVEPVATLPITPEVEEESPRNMDQAALTAYMDRKKLRGEVEGILQQIIEARNQTKGNAKQTGRSTAYDENGNPIIDAKTGKARRNVIAYYPEGFNVDDISALGKFLAGKPLTPRQLSRAGYAVQSLFNDIERQIPRDWVKDSDLAVGDKVVIDSEDFTVESKDASGTVLKDGTTIKVPPGGEVVIQRDSWKLAGSEQPPDLDTSFNPDDSWDQPPESAVEEEPVVPAAEQPPPPPPAAAAPALPSPEEAIDKGMPVKLPKGATFIRLTDPQGRQSLQAADALRALKGAGPFAKVEPGIRSGKKGEFVPMDEPIIVRPPPPKQEGSRRTITPADLMEARSDIRRHIPGIADLGISSVSKLLMPDEPTAPLGSLPRNSPEAAWNTLSPKVKGVLVALAKQVDPQYRADKDAFAVAMQELVVPRFTDQLTGLDGQTVSDRLEAAGVYEHMWKEVQRVTKKETANEQKRTVEQAPAGEPGSDAPGGGSTGGERTVSDVERRSLVDGRNRDAVRLDKTLDVYVGGAQSVGLPKSTIERSVGQITHILDTYDHLTGTRVYGRYANRTNDAFPDKPKLIVLGNEPGTGKTFIAAAVAGEIKGRIGTSRKPRILWVTMNGMLVDQAKSDTAAYGIEDVQYMTYHGVMGQYNKEKKTLPPEMTEAWDLIIFDEAHYAKNVGKATTAKAVAALAPHATLALYATATPIENPAQTKYLKDSGIWDNYPGGWRAWAMNHGMDKAGVWHPNKEKALAARKWLEDAGVMTTQQAQLPPGMVDVHLTKIDLEAEELRIRNIVDSAFHNAIMAAKKAGDGNAGAMLSAQHTMLALRVLESFKVRKAIQLMQQEYAESKEIGENRRWFLMSGSVAEREVEETEIEYSDRRAFHAMTPESALAVVEAAEAAAEAAKARARASKSPEDATRADEAAAIAKKKRTYLPLAGTPPPLFLILYGRAHNEMVAAGLVNPKSVVEEIMQVGTEMGLNPVKITASVSRNKRTQNLQDFRTGKSRLLVATTFAGGVGLSAHDVIGGMPTSQIVFKLPWTGTQIAQTAGRTARYGMKTPARQHWLFSNDPMEMRNAAVAGQRLVSMKATVHGMPFDPTAEDIANFEFDKWKESEAEDINDLLEDAETNPAIRGAIMGALGSGMQPSGIAGSLPSWMVVAPTDRAMAKIVRQLAADKVGRIGMRTAIDEILSYFHLQFRAGKEGELRKGRWGGFYRQGSGTIGDESALEFSMFHEIGHGVWQQMIEKDPALAGALETQLLVLTDKTVYPDTGASAENDREGAAEFFRRYVHNYTSIQDKALIQDMEEWLEKNEPEFLAKLRGFTIAYNTHKARDPIIARTADRKDVRTRPTSSKSSSIERLMQQYVSANYALFYTDRRIWGEARRNAAYYESQRTTATAELDQVLQELKDTPGDPRLAYAMLMHLPVQIEHALNGNPSGKAALYAISNAPTKDAAALGSFFGPLWEKHLQDAFGFVPQNEVFGEPIKMSDMSYSDAIKPIKNTDWDAFTTYGDDKAALWRFVNKTTYGDDKAKRHAYPGMDLHPPSVLRSEIEKAEREHPEWKKAFSDINMLYDRLLLMSAMAGERSLAEVFTMKGYDVEFDPLTGQPSVTYKYPVKGGKPEDQHEPYWYLLRNPELRMEQGIGPGVEGPQTHIKKAYGSPAPYAELHDAFRRRLTDVLEMWARRNLLTSVILYGQKGSQADNLDPETRREFGRIAIEIKPDLRHVATLNETEEEKILNQLALWINENMKPAKPIGPEDINIQVAGMKIWRFNAPRAYNIVMLKGATPKDTKFFQIEDPQMFALFAQQPEAWKGWKEMNRLFLEAVQERKKSITSTIFFVIRNLFRDPATFQIAAAGESLGAASRFWLTPYAVGFYAKYFGGDLGDYLETETFGEYQTAVKGQTLGDRSAAIKKDAADIAASVKDHHLVGTSLAAAEVTARSVMAAVTLKTKILNTLWRLVSLTLVEKAAKATESAPRRAAAYLARKQGRSTAYQMMLYDEISGHFLNRAMNTNAASAYRLMGFVNPTVQITGMFHRQLASPNPRVRREAWTRMATFALTGPATILALWWARMAHEPDEEKRKRMMNAHMNRTIADRGKNIEAFGLRIPMEGVTGMTIASMAFGIDEYFSRIYKTQGRGALLRQSTESAKAIMGAPGSPTAFAKSLGTTVASMAGFTPKTLVELASNYSAYRDSEIVPRNLERWRNEDSPVWDTTPTSYRWLADHLGGIHPVKLQYFMRNAISSQADDALKLADILRGRRDMQESADTPFLGPIFQRRATGWMTQQVRSIVEMETKYGNAKDQLANLIKDYGEGSPEATRVRAQLDNLEKAHHAYEKIQAAQRQVAAHLKALRRATSIQDASAIRYEQDRIREIRDGMTLSAIEGLGEENK